LVAQFYWEFFKVLEYVQKNRYSDKNVLLYLNKNNKVYLNIRSFSIEVFNKM